MGTVWSSLRDFGRLSLLETHWYDGGRKSCHLGSCDIHLATGTGPWEHPAESYRLAGILASRGVRHSLDDWGPQGGHDWPYWRHMMSEYMNYV